MSGVGVVLVKGGKLIGIDLDACILHDGIAPWAREIIELGETYAERSPSGRGIRLFARGQLENDKAIAAKDAGVEVYSWGRYLTVTGDHIEGTPTEIREAPKMIARLLARVEEWKAAKQPIALPASPKGEGDFFRRVNDLALHNLELWVPRLFGSEARYQSGTGAYRVSSKSLRRDLQEDLSIAPNGIVDFGVHDMGDRRGGKRSPIDLVMEHAGEDLQPAAFWLCRHIGRSPESLGWKPDGHSQLDVSSYVASVASKPEAVTEQVTARTGLRTVVASTLADERVEPRRWHVPDLIPACTVTLLGGDGAAGKSLLALQLAVSTAIGGKWIARDVAAGRALYLSAEDELKEVHRRLADICRAGGFGVDALSELMIVPLAEERDAVIAAPERSGLIKPTALWAAIEAVVDNERPALIVLDTLADLFAGEENSRTQARQFIQLLRGMAISREATIVLLAHPSLSGMASGSGTSGSTAWSNSVRSRLYMRREYVTDKSNEVFEPNPDLRVLETKKANYAQRGTSIRLRWHEGIFVSDEVTPAGTFGAANRMMQIESVFLDLVRFYDRTGRNVSALRGANFAPAIFGMDERSQGIRKHEFIAGMNRLFEAGTIKMIDVGPAYRRVKKIVIPTDHGIENDE